MKAHEYNDFSLETRLGTVWLGTAKFFRLSDLQLEMSTLPVGLIFIRLTRFAGWLDVRSRKTGVVFRHFIDAISSALKKALID